MLTPEQIRQADATTGIQQAARDALNLLESYRHKMSERLAIDFKLNPETGEMLLHVFPNVPRHRGFYPDNQSFAKLVEDQVLLIVGPDTVIEAEFHEIDGRAPDGSPEDTTVRPQLRKPDGSPSQITYSEYTPMVFIRIEKPKRVMANLSYVLEVIVDGIVAAYES
jgi:hypothetical protein